MSVSTSKAFIHRAEAAGKERHAVRLLHEVQLAGEEVVEVDQLRVAVDRLIRALLEGQPDIQAEAVLAPAPFCAAPMMPSPPPVMIM
jgi:CHAD domain-containing protein